MLLDILEEPLEVVECAVDTFAQGYSRLELRLQRVLHVVEHITRSWQGKRYGTQLAKHFVPFAHTSALLDEGDAGKYFGQLLNTMQMQVKCHADCVNNPAQHDLDGAP